jgi:hypothetical protein
MFINTILSVGRVTFVGRILDRYPDRKTWEIVKLSEKL